MENIKKFQGQTSLVDANGNPVSELTTKSVERLAMSVLENGVESTETKYAFNEVILPVLNKNY